MVGSTEEGQVVLVDVLGDVEPVGLDQLLVLRQLILVKTKQWKQEKDQEGKDFTDEWRRNSRC